MTATGAVLAVLLIAAMLAVGTTVDLASFRRVLRRPTPVIVALVVNLVVLPGLGLLLLDGLDVTGPAAVGIMLAAAAPGGGSGALLAHHARGDAALSVSVQALLALTGLVALPTWLAVADVWLGLGLSSIPAAGAVLLVAGSLVGQLVPLVAGMLLRAYRPPLAARVQAVARRTADVLLAGIVVWSLVANANRLGQVPVAAYAAMAAVVTLGLASYLMPGLGGPAARGAVAMTTTVRNLSLALFVAAFATDADQVILTVLAYGLVMYGAAVAVIGPMRRSATIAR